MKRQNKTTGEFAFIQRLTKGFPKLHNNIIKGIGDDCAILEQKNGIYTLVTCDIQVADVHFLSNAFKPEDIGEKALAVNISDIAAMGGKPTYCLVSLVLPENLNSTYTQRIYKGIRKLCNRYNISLVGGNTSKGKQLAIDIFLMGEVKPDELLLRSGARIGDKVLVTGSLGDAAAGLAILQYRDLDLSDKEKMSVVKRQCTPTPRLEESTILTSSKKVTAMIDISDGLVNDVLHICDASNTGVIIWEEKLPITNATRKIAEKLGKNPFELALNGGEDYELLFTVPASEVDLFIKTVGKQTGTAVSVIGEVLPKEKGQWIVQSNGKRKKLMPEGWNHIQL